jgi:hypothetical protein
MRRKGEKRQETQIIDYHAQARRMNTPNTMAAAIGNEAWSGGPKPDK